MKNYELCNRDIIPKNIIQYREFRDRNTAIIVKNREIIDQISRDNLFAVNELVDGKTTLLSLEESKGLEFNNVFAFVDGMDKNEQYIACTRALNKLYVVM